MFCSILEKIFYLFYDFAHKEGLTLNLIDALNFYRGEFCLKIIGKLTHIKFGYNHFVITRQHFGCIGGQRIDIAELSERYRRSLLYVMSVVFG